MEPANAVSHLQSVNPKVGVGSTADEVVGTARIPTRAPSATEGGQVIRTVSPAPSAKEFAASERHDEGQKEDVAHAVRDINEFFQMVRRTLQFSLDDESGRVVVKIKDAETDEVIRQIPSEDILRLARYLGEFKEGFKGLLFEDSA